MPWAVLMDPLHSHTMQEHSDKSAFFILEQTSETPDTGIAKTKIFKPDFSLWDLDQFPIEELRSESNIIFFDSLIPGKYLSLILVVLSFFI